MSKRFLSGINVTGTATLNTVANAGLDTDKFLVLDAAGNVDFRTGAELRLDIGADVVSKVQHEVKLGESMTIGTPVYVPLSQDSGTNMTVLKASNASEGTSSKTMGLIASSGVTNDLVQVITEGLLAGLNTGTATKGDPVWLGVNGALIFGLANKPVAPAHLVFIGIVTRAQTNNGEIFVKVQNGFEMNELHNYAEGSVQNNEVIVYESATSLYKPKSIPTILGYTPVPETRTITINGTTYDLSANRSWTISANLNARTEYEFTTDGTTATYSAVYSIGQVDVFYNGSKLSSTEFTATNGTSVTLGFTPPSGQLVEVVAWETGGGVSSGRTLTINGTTYDLSANRSWTIDNASLGAQPQLNGTGLVRMSGTTVSYDNSTYLIASAVSGTAGYIPKFTGSGSIGNSSLSESGSVMSVSSDISVLRFNNSSFAGIQYYNYLSIGIPALYTAIYFDSSGNTTIGGTLSGTSATFSSSISATIGSFSNYIAIGGTSGLNTYGTINQPAGEKIIFNAYHGLELRTSGGVGSGTPISVFSITSSGSATFGSDVFTYNNGGIFFSGGGTYGSGIFQNPSGSLVLKSGGADRLTINSAGSATFSNNVTATAFISSTYNLIGEYYSESSFATPYFPHGVANQCIDIRLGNGYLNGWIEIEITGGYNQQNTTGILRAVISFGLNPNNSQWQPPIIRIAEAQGTVVDNIYIGNIEWDSSTSQYRIPIFHTVSTGNDYTIHINHHKKDSTNIAASATLSPIYTRSAPSPSRQYVYYNESVGIGKSSPSERLHILGNTYIEGTGNALYFDTDAGAKTISQYVANLYEFNILNARGNSSRFILGNNSISLGTSGTKQFYINTSNGYVGIGYDNPGYKLDIWNNGADVFRVANTSGSSGNNPTAMFLNSYGNHSWGICAEFRVGGSGGTDSSSILFSQGYNTNTWAIGFGYADTGYFRINRDQGMYSGSWGTTLFSMDRSGNYSFAGSNVSDRRNKKDINYITNPQLDTILKLKPASFVKKSPGKNEYGAFTHTGFIAQDILEDDIPNLVHGNNTDGYALDYDGILAIAVKSIQELKAENDELRAILNRNNII